MQEGKNEKEKNCHVTLKNGMHKDVTLDDIVYVQAKGIHTNIHTTEENLEVRQPFRMIVKDLDQDEFVASHRNYCINLKYAQELTKGECMLEDGSVIPISRLAFKRVNHAFMNYYCKRPDIQ